ncbi:urea carboxylase-associated family protein [Dactylosporangium roseum]
MRAGGLVEVVDVEGSQVGDLWAIDVADPRRWLSTSHTRDTLEQLFPRVGQSFVDQRYQPILELVADTSPGLHDMLFPACNPALYAREGSPQHPNCADNFVAAAGQAGVTLPAVPDPVNLFQNSAPDADGRIAVHAAITRPGDRVRLRALRDITLVLTACAVDFWPTNGERCTSLRLDQLDGDGN